MVSPRASIATSEAIFLARPAEVFMLFVRKASAKRFRRPSVWNVLRALLARGAIGLITTHDLALTGIADDLTPRAANIHFDDFFEGDEIRFDYRVKLGPVTRSNALALMRAVGLELEPEL